jgi:Zn-dependent protease
MNIDWVNMLYSLPAVILGLTIHEFSHAFSANKLGDDTAKNQGRITLNPIKHIDVLGMVFIILAGFGWAKPVEFNPDKLKSPKRDKILIALAGPLSNLFMGILFLFLIKIFIVFSYLVSENTYTIVVNILYYISVINLGLFIFNILPIPPLDGSHIFLSGLDLTPDSEQKFIKFGSIALFIILFIENKTNIDIIPISKFTNYIVGLFF